MILEAAKEQPGNLIFMVVSTFRWSTKILVALDALTSFTNALQLNLLKYQSQIQSICFSFCSTL